MCGQTCLELALVSDKDRYSRRFFFFAVYLDDLAKLCNRKINVFITLYADDILLLSPAVACM